MYVGEGCVLQSRMDESKPPQGRESTEWHLSLLSMQSTVRLPHSRTHQTKQLCPNCTTLGKPLSHLLLILQISVHPGGRGTARTQL